MIGDIPFKLDKPETFVASYPVRVDYSTDPPTMRFEPKDGDLVFLDFMAHEEI